MGIGHGPVTCLEATRMLSSIDSLRFYSSRCVMCDCSRLLTSQGSEKGKKKVCCENDFRWHVNIYIYLRENFRRFLEREMPYMDRYSTV